jgi:hypothetical protein
VTAPPTAPLAHPSGLRTCECPAGALAFLRRLPKRRDAEAAKGQHLYLLRTGLVAIPEHRLNGSWRCIPVADFAGPLVQSRLTVPDIEIETALAVHAADPLAGIDSASYAAIWQARVCDRWPGGHLPQLARILAEELLETPTRTVALSHCSVVARILRQVHLVPVGLRQLLTRLVDAGLLVPDVACHGSSWGSYTLTLPGDHLIVSDRGRSHRR